MGSVAGAGAVVGTAAAQDGEDEDGSSRSGDGRPVQSPTRVTQDGVTIDFESCQVCHVTGDPSEVMYTEAHFEYYDVARGSTSHYVQSFWGDIPLTIDASEIAETLSPSAETAILGQVEVWGTDFMPVTSLTQPAQWECRNQL